MLEKTKKNRIEKTINYGIIEVGLQKFIETISDKRGLNLNPTEQKHFVDELLPMAKKMIVKDRRAYFCTETQEVSAALLALGVHPDYYKPHTQIDITIDPLANFISCGCITKELATYKTVRNLGLS